MPEKKLRRWITVNDYMDREYCEKVIQIALNHREHASLDVRKMANHALSSIVVPGFRSFQKVPVSVAIPYVVKQFQKRREITLAILGLWSEACLDIIEEVKSRAVMQGFFFKEPWTWKEAQIGYIAFEDIPDFHAFIEPLVAEKDKLEHDHWMLAELWLSVAITDESSTLTIEESAKDVIAGIPDEPDPTLVSQAESNEVKEAVPMQINSKLQEALLETLDTSVIEPVSSEEINLENIWENLGLVDLLQKAEQIHLQVESSQTDLLELTQNFNQAVEKMELQQAKAHIDGLTSRFSDWQKTLEQSESITNYAVYRLQSEFNKRPDLDQPNFLEQPALAKLRTSLQAILEYDTRTQAMIKALEHLQGEIITADKEWLEWQDTPDLLDNNYQAFKLVDPVDLTLTQLIEEERRLQNRIASLKSNSQQVRERNINRICSNLEKFSELDDSSKIQIDGKTLDQIRELDLPKWGGQKIRHLDATLQAELNQQSVKSQPGKIMDYAKAIGNDWSDKRFHDLLFCLAADHRDTDLFLVLLAAIIGREKPGIVTLPPNIYLSLLSGAVQFAGKNQPIDVIGQAMPTLVNGYLLENENVIADFCIIGLAVHYCANYRLPDGLLWQIATDWPIGGMPGWNKLWQSALLGETCPIYTDHKKKELREKLAQARANAEKDFTRDGAHFIRLSSLQSYRHLAMLTPIMQSCASKLEILKKQDSAFAKAKSEQLSDMVNDLNNFLQNDIGKSLSENNLYEMYTDGIRADKIDDSNPFHQRSSLRILNDCAKSIIEYGNALYELWDLTAQRMTGLNSETLLSELNVLPNLSIISKAAAELIIRSEPHIQKPWDDNICGDELKQYLIVELLSQQTFTLRLPHLVSYLVGNAFNWRRVLDELIQGFATSLDPIEIASYLLEHNAPNQVLGLVQFIPLELQNRAQSLRSENEHLCDRLILEHLQLGGKADDLNQARELGRWGWLLDELNQRIRSQRIVVQAEHQEVENRTRVFRKNIQDLDDAIFDDKEQIPRDVYELIQHGLATARSAYSNKDMFTSLDEYLREVQYRLAHNSWSLLPLQKATEQLEKALVGKKDIHDLDLTGERVLELLDRNELEILGLTKIDASEVNTRINVLTNWLRVKKIHSIQGKDLLQTELSTIQALFSYFARMMSMTRFRTKNGKSLDSIDPIMFEYWEMRYPRTSALDNQYVFITLPGDPPTTKDLQALENILEETEFLEYYFVLLFVPGSTEKINRRLQHKGLIIIDESRLIDMILSDANDNIPLGILRPMVLTSIEANADIFITNQSVNARTSIFVGRENLVDRIVNGGDNYAIYGGRRIGKSSVLKAVEQRLEKRGYRIASLSLEGEKDFTDDYISLRLAQMLNIDAEMTETGSFKQAMVSYMENNDDLKLAILLDEIDRYITVNSNRHTLIEALRTCSDRFGNRFRVIIAGFMNLYDCLHGHGPYTPNSDPWQRMFTDNRELENLPPTNAEAIVREGFISILGWKFDNRAIPQRIVERTGGHPAFVQAFCLKLLERIRNRKDNTVCLSDIEAVFNDQDPRNSFIAYVRDTLNLNLEPVSNYLIFWLAADVGDAQGFTIDKIRYIANMSNIKIPENHIKRSLELLKVTSVIRERMSDVFDFTVPDYASILNRLGNTSHMDNLEEKLKEAMK